MIVLLILGFIKAKLLVKIRQDPFLNTLNQEFKEEIPEELMSAVNDSFHHLKPEVLSFELYCCITEKLTNYNENDENDKHLPNMPCRDIMYGYLEEYEKEEMAREILNYLNKNLLGKHTASIFRHLLLKN